MTRHEQGQYKCNVCKGRNISVLMKCWIPGNRDHDCSDIDVDYDSEVSLQHCEDCDEDAQR